MRTKPDINVEKLVQQWITEKAKNTGLEQRPYVILFPHLEHLTDKNVRSFFEGVKREGYAGTIVYDKVDEVRYMADTYYLITQCVRGGFII